MTMELHVPSAHSIYFQSASLRQRYIAELQAALLAATLCTEEHDWLLCLVRDDAEPDTEAVRVDHLVFDDGRNTPLDMAAALLLSHPTSGSPTVYLHTLAQGVESFADRAALLAVLRERFADNDSQSAFEYERLEGDPFRAQMIKIVDSQAERVEQMTEALSTTPTLFSAASAALSEPLQRSLPDRVLNPTVNLLQIVQTASGDSPEKVLMTQTLAQAAYDDFCKRGLIDGVDRRFLDAQGRVLPPADAARLARAITEAVAATGERFDALLKDFWADGWRGQRTRRDQAIDTFDSSFRHAVYRSHQQGEMTSLEWTALRSWLHEMRAPLSKRSGIRCSRLVITAEDGTRTGLAGTFVLHLTQSADDALWWFSPDHVLRRFADVTALHVYLSSAEGRTQLRPALPLASRSAFDALDSTRPVLEDIEGQVYANRIESIIAWQASNLAYVCTLSCDADQVSAMFDDALDVRQLLDPWQLQFSAGRWREQAPFDFLSVWRLDGDGSAVQAGVSAAEQEDALDHVGHKMGETAFRASARAMLTPSWREQMNVADRLAGELHELNHGLRDHARLALQRYLCVADVAATRAQEVRLCGFEAVPAPSAVEPPAHEQADGDRLMPISIDLVSLLLERVTGQQQHALDAYAGLEVTSTNGAPLAIEPALLEHALQRAATDFTEAYLRHYWRSRTQIQRKNGSHWQPVVVASNIRQDAARIDLALRQRLELIPLAGLSMAQQVLDRPDRSQRLSETITEAYSVTLLYGMGQAVFSDVMVLSQPSKPEAGVMMWSSLAGWRRYPFVERLDDRIRAHFHGPLSERWLDLLGEKDRSLLREHLHAAADNAVSVRLELIEGHAFDALQLGALVRQKQNLRQLCERAVRCRFGPSLFLGLASAAEPDEPLQTLLDGLSLSISQTLLDAMLPPWLRAVSLNDLWAYVRLWQRYYQASEGGQDFLFGISSLQEYAGDRLVTQLRLDFPGHDLNPDLINVTVRHYVPAPTMIGQTPSAIPGATIIRTESLTEYSANRFASFQDAVLSVESAEQANAVALLQPDYVRRIVKTLDVGAGFMDMLRQGLDPSDRDYALRRRLFTNQLPLTLQIVAFHLKEEKSLSATAFEFISRVLEMPDGIARDSMGGERVIISRLQLVADSGMQPDSCLGLYLIGPADSAAGPVVLHAMQHPGFRFQEFPSRAALMTELRGNTELQALLLQRLEPEVRGRYENSGFTEPHLPFFAAGLGDVPLRPPGPVALAIEAIKGNALDRLFDDTCTLLIEDATANTISTEEANQASRRFLMTLGLEQGLTLLPGKLAALVALWQSHSLVRASFDSASGKRWGEALSEFSAALGVMATARGQALEERLLDDLQAEAVDAALPTEDNESPIGYSWQRTPLNTEQLIRLHAMAVKDVALNDLRHDQLLNVYRTPQSNVTYAAVSGRIYRVSRDPQTGRWQIIGANGTPGPTLMLDDNQRWQIDLRLGLKGGGPVLTRFKNEFSGREAGDTLIIEAEGMPQIRLLHRDKARRIGQAHLRAKRCLENCLDNLHTHQQSQPLDPRVVQILTEFFGVRKVDRPVLLDVERVIKTLFEELMDASLSPFSSPRFVVGTNRPGSETTIGFVYKQDPQKRIYLTENFFQVPPYRLNARAVSEGFEFAPHFRAATLLHELSHLALATHDIAYLESSAPFPDLIAQNDVGNVRLKADIERIQSHELSSLSERGTLFRMLENDQWRDIRPEDNRGYDTILRVTGTTSLEEARDVFLADPQKRRQVMLSNADSMALLILRLGRRNFVVPPR
jgi:hypothetical protein